MTVTTVFGDAADDDVYSIDITYATARAGPADGVGGFGADRIGTGQQEEEGDYWVIEGFIAFDTSSIPDGDTVSAAVLSLWGVTDASTTDFTVEARLKDWGATVTTADWVAGASLSALTRVATFATSGWATGAYNAFTEDGTNFQAGIDKTGVTRLLTCSSRTVAGTTPPSFEYVTYANAETGGTTNDPKLVVTHEAGGGIFFGTY